jgi:hypothetical protein
MLSEQALMRVGQAFGSDLLAGLWLLVAPFVLGYAELLGPLWNDVIIGAVIAVVAVLRIGTGLSERALSRALAMLGSWLIVAPFVLGYASVETEVARGAAATANGALVTILAETASGNDVLVGIAVLVLAARSAAAAGLSARAPAAPAREFARRRGE